MNSYLFTLAIGVQDRPERWGSVSGYYLKLAATLKKLGHEVTFAINPALRRRSAFLKVECYALDGLAEFEDFFDKRKFTHVFIWGGRLEADREVYALLARAGVKVIFSELGWFPQAESIYFDDKGTNAEVSFNNKIYPPCSAGENKLFNKQRKAFYRKKAGLGFLSVTPVFSIKLPDMSKPILVPLQDESDTNITLASPFRTMAEFVDCLAMNYPNYRFIVRPHPSAPAGNLPVHSNVTYQSASVNIYRTMKDYGMVIGINSTLLLEASMMNVPVAAFGRGVGTGTGVFHELVKSSLPRDLGKLRINSMHAKAYLAFLIGRRQLFKKDLVSRKKILNSYLKCLLSL